MVVQGLVRQPLKEGIREAYALAGVEMQSGSGYRFGLGVGLQVLGSQAGALVMLDLGVSWGLRYRNPLAESLAGKRRIPALWMDKHGVYEANVMIEGVKKGARSTFFPKDWSQEQVEQAILEAYENRMPDRDTGFFIGTGGGIEIKIQLKNNEQIHTAFPIMQGKP